jgi:DNA-binding SARP family transcriptional activator
VIGELEALVAAHPGDERLAALLMLAQYRCGRQGDALDVYARTRAYLTGELGLEPGPPQDPAERDPRPVTDAALRLGAVLRCRVGRSDGGAVAAGRRTRFGVGRQAGVPAVAAPARLPFVGRDL